ncbi:hypothetical protein ACFQ7O_24095 [Streptomyces sp. NPDC056485]|uniref:hypothetical protein n=1 Tax=Streptomyces sp. NPDC056485 TaxID=3345834 RepID=UPI0036B058BF
MSTPPDPTPAPPAGPPAGNPSAPAPPPAPDPAAPPAPDDVPLGPAGEKALTEWKTRAKTGEKALAEATARLKEFEDAQKTETEKLAERATAAEQREAAATRLAVASKVEALAVGTFEDPEDAIGSLDPAAFITDGVIDTEAIKTALAQLLERKPHWAKASGPRVPKPDPAQGPRPGAVPGDIESQIRDAQAKGDWRTALSLQNQKLADLK